MSDVDELPLIVRNVRPCPECRRRGAETLVGSVLGDERALVDCNVIVTSRWYLLPHQHRHGAGRLPRDHRCIAQCWPERDLHWRAEWREHRWRFERVEREPWPEQPEAGNVVPLRRRELRGVEVFDVD